MRLLFEGGYTIFLSKGNHADTIQGRALFDVRVLFEGIIIEQVVRSLTLVFSDSSSECFCFKLISK